MTQLTDADLQDATVYDADDNKLGNVTAVYYDDETNQPEWASVATGLFGKKETLVPLSGATRDGDRLRVPFDKDRIKNAPHVDPDGELSPEQEVDLFEYYNIPYGGDTVTATGTPAEGAAPYPDEDATSADAQSSGRSGRATDDDAMTRSEERLQVGKEKVEAGRVRLRKYVVTENVTQTVPVTHEEVRLEREPITGDYVDAATSGADISEAEHEVTLHEERPVVGKETVPVERVRLAKDTVQGEEQVSEDVRKEQIETDGPVDR